MTVNIMVSGTHGVGKTRFIQKLLGKTLCPNDTTYVDPKLTEEKYQSGSDEYRVLLFENSGQNQFVCSRLISMGQMCSSILLLNLSDQNCIESLTNQLIDFQSYQLKTFVVGMIDTTGKRLRTKSQMIAHCRNYNCSYFEVDSIDKKGLQQLFQIIRTLSFAHYKRMSK